MKNTTTTNSAVKASMVTAGFNAVDEICLLHRDILESARTTLNKAVRVGELLAEQKAKLKHGQWLPWIAENLPFDRATAANYMRVYTRRDELKCKTVLHLSNAYRLLSASVETASADDADNVNVYADRLSEIADGVIAAGTKKQKECFLESLEMELRVVTAVLRRLEGSR